MLLGPCSGLLVDWLEMLDPEVVGSCPDLQQRLLFSRGKVGLTGPARALPSVLAGPRLESHRPDKSQVCRASRHDRPDLVIEAGGQG